MKTRVLLTCLVVIAAALAIVPADPATADAPPPVPVQVAAGDYHTCAVWSNGAVKCWGLNSGGSLGDGTATAEQLSPVDVVGLGSGVTAIAAGGYHTCALLSTGTVKCWGSNGSGQLGDGTTNVGPTPVDVIGLGSVVAIAAGDQSTCALLSTGGLKCWGRNEYGQIGDGTTINRLTPVDVVGLGSGVAAISAGTSHACAVTVAGAAKCWGRNAYGQIGDGTTTDRLTPVDVVGLGSGVATIAAGGGNTCATTVVGAAKCWGANAGGQVGDGTNTGGNGGTDTDRLTPVDVVGLGSGVTAITAGGALPSASITVCVGTGGGPCNPTTVYSQVSSSCGLTSAGAVKCWGYNAQAQLGDGTATGPRRTPVDVVGLSSGVTAISASLGHHHCVITASGAIKCWGFNAYGQLGDGTKGNQYSRPVDVEGLGSGVAAITTARSHACMLTAGAALKCWGNNSLGQLGDGTTTNRTTPVDVVGLGSDVAAITDSDGHMCALTAAGAVKCWGDNSAGQLGDGTTTNRSTPVDVVGLGSGVAAITAGDFLTCALLTTGAVKCWGYNHYGDVGDGTTTNRSTPVDVVGLGSDVVAIASDPPGYHVCALTAGGAVKCWGYNGRGQLGNGTTTNTSTPVDVVGLGSGVAAITPIGNNGTCVVTADGAVKCWGYNAYGQVGDGTTTDRLTPVDVVGLGSGVSTITADADGSHVCALTTTGSVKCWGYNHDGQIGDGTTTDRPTPVDVVELGSGVTAITSAVTHTCGLTTDGAVKCWGQNTSGELGDGTTTDRSTPVDVIGFGSGVATMGVDPGYVCALTAAGAVKCWGANTIGQLGVPGAIRGSIPVDVVTQWALPGAPSAVVGTAGDGQMALSWTAPSRMGDSPVTDYEVSVFDAYNEAATGVTGAMTRSVGSATTSYVFTGLSNGTEYRFRIATVNAAGTSPLSASSAPATPSVSTVPAAPTIGTVTLVGRTASVPFTPPTANGGSAITAYAATCTSTDGGTTRSGSSAASPVVVSLLSPGNTYACEVAATNAVGTGAESAPSNMVTVARVPDAPTAAKVVSGSTTAATGSLTVTFTIGANNGNAIMSQTATCVSSNGGVTKTGTHSGATAAPITVAAVTTAKLYTCTVKATNAVGPSAASTPSSAAIVGSPAAPSGVKVVSGSTTAATGSLTVTFTIGANNGNAIMSQTATCVSSNGGVTKTGTHSGATAAPITVAAVTTAKLYTCTVKATNARGAGITSASSLPVIIGSPAAPTSVTAAHLAAGQIRVTFTPGANNGNAATSYTATCISSNGGVIKTKTGTASPLTVTALTVGKSYTCTVRGTNARGAGLASSPSGTAIA